MKINKELLSKLVAVFESDCDKKRRVKGVIIENFDIVKINPTEPNLSSYDLSSV